MNGLLVIFLFVYIMMLVLIGGVALFMLGSLLAAGIEALCDWLDL